MTDKTQQNTDPNAQADAGDKPESMRDTIRAAFAEQKEKEKDLKAQETDPKEPKVETDPKEPKEPEKKDEPKEPEKVEGDPKEPKEPDKVETDPKEPKEPKIEAKVKIPFGLPKAIKDKFDKIDPEVQEYLSKTVKENLDNKANEGRRAPMREVEQALAPIMQEMQQAGVTPAQFVKRMVDYTYALAHPQAKYNAIAQLANDYQIDLSLFSKRNDDDPSKTVDDNQPVDTIPPELNAKLDSIINRFSQLETTQKSDNEKAAVEQINGWAGFDPSTKEFKAKPYFPYVRQTMHSLIASGAVPLKDGKIDLDGAYDAACYAHPEIREHMVDEQNKAAQAEVLRQQQQKQQQIDRARNAGSSLKPGAPGARSPNTNSISKVNAKGQPNSVRDSLRQAIAQMRETQ